MPDKKRVLSLPTLDRLFRLANVPEYDLDAQLALAEVLEECALEILDISMELLHHANRKTMKDDDLGLAYETWLKNLRKEQAHP